MNRIDFRPMSRLLSNADFDFLSSQPGFEPAIAKRLRARRVSLYKHYLHLLRQEFQRLHVALRLLTLSAHHDRPEISRLLIEQKLLFTLHMLHARIRLAFFGLGMRPLDLTPMVQTVEGMRASVRELSLPVAAELASLPAAR